MGLDRLELSTSRLSGVRSNHLSYRPQLGSPKATKLTGSIQQVGGICSVTPSQPSTGGSHDAFSIFFRKLLDGIAKGGSGSPWTLVKEVGF